MKLLVPDIILLMQREQQRLNNQCKRLLRYDLDVEKLKKYRQGWEDNLGFMQESERMIQEITTLIRSLEQGEHDERRYDEVCMTIGLYKTCSWQLIRHFEGSLSPYMDRWTKVILNLKTILEPALNQLKRSLYMNRVC